MRRSASLSSSAAKASALDAAASHGTRRRHQRTARARAIPLPAHDRAALHSRARRRLVTSPAIGPRPVTSTSPRFRKPATPAARICSSSGSRKGACFPPPSKIRCCSTTSARRSQSSLRLSKDRVDEAVWAALSRLAHACWSGRPQLLVARRARVSRDLRVVADAAGVPRQAWRRIEVLPRSARGAGRGEVVRARHARRRRDGSGMVACAASSPAGASAVPEVLKHFPAIAQGRRGRHTTHSRRRSPRSTAMCLTPARCSIRARFRTASRRRHSKRRRMRIPALPEARPSARRRGRS